LLLLDKKIQPILSRASAEKFPRGGGQRKEDRKITKKTENSTIKPLPGEQRKKDRKITKKTENSTIKPLPGRATEKRPKNSKKKHRKIALLSLYLLYMSHV